MGCGEVCGEVREGGGGGSKGRCGGVEFLYQVFVLFLRRK